MTRKEWIIRIVMSLAFYGAIFYDDKLVKLFCTAVFMAVLELRFGGTNS